MPDGNQPCPICPQCGSSDVVWLEAVSRDSQVDYCRCQTCGHVFSVTRDKSRTIRDVTKATRTDDEV